MKSARHAPIFATGIKLLVAVGVSTAVLVLVIYMGKFAAQSGYSLSEKTSVWGEFGDYFGGVLNPIFSFLAFTGVLFTVFLQARQLDIARDHANFEELQRMLTTISASIDSMLNHTPLYYAAKGHIREDLAPLTLFNHVSGFGTDLLKPTEQRDFDNAFRADAVQGLKDDIAMSVRALSLEFHSLGWAMEKYAAAGGNETVLEFYRFRYGAVVTWLDAMDALDSTSRIRNVMDLALLKRSMTETSEADQQTEQK